MKTIIREPICRRRKPGLFADWPEFAERVGVWFCCAAVLFAVVVLIGNGVRYALNRVGNTINVAASK